MVDNDALLKSTSDATLKEIYELANAEAVTALGSLLSKQSDDSIPVGLNKVLGTVFHDGYSFLRLGFLRFGGQDRGGALEGGDRDKQEG